jgi:hypothetical protein
MTTRKERTHSVCDIIEDEWEEEFVLDHKRLGVKTNRNGRWFKNSMLTPKMLRRFPELLIDANDKYCGYLYAANENATAEIVYELAKKDRERSLEEYFAPYFRCSKRFMDDYANWKWDDVGVEWRQVACNIHLTREFVEKYLPHEYVEFALSVHHNVAHIESLSSVVDGLFSIWHVFNANGLRYNKNITSEFVMKHRRFEGFHRYIRFYTEDGLKALNSIEYPLVCWNDFTIEYFDGLRSKFGDDDIIRFINFDDVLSHPVINVEYFENMITEIGKTHNLSNDKSWRLFAGKNQNCTIKMLRQRCRVSGIILWYNNWQHEKKLFVEKKTRKHLAAYKIQQWWLFITSSPEYAVGRRRIEAGFDAEFGEKM